MTALGGYTFPSNSIDEDNAKRKRIHYGNQKPSLNGTMNSQTFTSVWEWEITGTDLTGAQLTSLLAELDDRGSQSWTPPEGGSFTVVVMGDPVVPYRPDSDGSTPLYTVEFVVREAS